MTDKTCNPGNVQTDIRGDPSGNYFISTPKRRKISMLRPLVISIFGVVWYLCCVQAPHSPSNLASAMARPTGPAPAMRIDVCLGGWSAAMATSGYPISILVKRSLPFGLIFWKASRPRYGQTSLKVGVVIEHFKEFTLCQPIKHWCVGNISKRA